MISKTEIDAKAHWNHRSKDAEMHLSESSFNHIKFKIIEKWTIKKNMTNIDKILKQIMKKQWDIQKKWRIMKQMTDHIRKMCIFGTLSGI